MSSTKIEKTWASNEEEAIRLKSEEITVYLEAQPRPVSEKQIQMSVKGRKQIKTPALRQLVVGGKIRRSGDGVKGSPYLYSFPAFEPNVVPLETSAHKSFWE